MIETSRRNFLGILAAPAILRVTKPMAIASEPFMRSFMRLDQGLGVGSIVTGIEDGPRVITSVAKGNSLLTIGDITREAVRLWKNSNAYLAQYDAEFADAMKTFDAKLQVRLPNDFSTRIK